MIFLQSHATIRDQPSFSTLLPLQPGEAFFNLNEILKLLASFANKLLIVPFGLFRSQSVEKKRPDRNEYHRGGENAQKKQVLVDHSSIPVRLDLATKCRRTARITQLMRKMVAESVTVPVPSIPET